MNLALVSSVFLWASRILGTLLVAVVLLFLIAYFPGPFGPGNPPMVRLQFSLMLTTLAGYAVMWRWPLAGAWLSLAALGAFYALEVSATGHLPHGLFPFFAIPPVLMLVARAAMERAV